MLLRYLDLLQHDPASYLILVGLTVLSVVIAVTIHEFSHAAIASSLGDHTARHQGRVSLNPVRHLDPAGSLLFLVAGFGWGKPVPVNPYRLAHGGIGETMVSAAGPLSNLATAFLMAVPIKLGVVDYYGFGMGSIMNLKSGSMGDFVAATLGMTVLFNLVLAVFNLIPLSPLDGSRVLGGLIPSRSRESYERFQRFGPVVLVGLIMLDFLIDFSILGTIISRPVNFLFSLAVGG